MEGVLWIIRVGTMDVGRVGEGVLLRTRKPVGVKRWGGEGDRDRDAGTARRMALERRRDGGLSPPVGLVVTGAVVVSSLWRAAE